MAIGNLLGQQPLRRAHHRPIDDLAYTKGPLLSAVVPAHAITAFAAVIMSGIFIVALLFRPGDPAARHRRLGEPVGCWSSICSAPTPSICTAIEATIDDPEHAA